MKEQYTKMDDKQNFLKAIVWDEIKYKKKQQTKNVLLI